MNTLFKKYSLFHLTNKKVQHPLYISYLNTKHIDYLSSVFVTVINQIFSPFSLVTKLKFAQYARDKNGQCS
jgi:hypothetical protein